MAKQFIRLRSVEPSLQDHEDLAKRSIVVFAGAEEDHLSANFAFA